MKRIALPPAADLDPAVVLARAGSNFASGFVCLDPQRRAGMVAIYAFCRVADDAVDDAADPETGRAHLQFWRDELLASAAGRANWPIGRALQATMQRFGMAVEPLAALLDGVATDLEPKGFADEAELRTYCWRVASAVGLACLPVLGANSPPARDFAEHLGQALQWTNILRDLRTDAEVGRVYVPRTWLTGLAVDPAWLTGRGPASAYAADGPVAALCARLATGARAEFAAAATALRRLRFAERRSLAPARVMGAVYAALLSRLERRGGELALPRCRVPKLQKLWLLAAVLLGWR